MGIIKSLLNKFMFGSIDGDKYPKLDKLPQPSREGDVRKGGLNNPPTTPPPPPPCGQGGTKKVFYGYMGGAWICPKCDLKKEGENDSV